MALLNVLDRCDKPIAMLGECRDRLKPSNGRLLLSIVIPYHPYLLRGVCIHDKSHN